MHRVDPDRDARLGLVVPSSDGARVAPDARQPASFTTTAAVRIRRMLAIVVGGAFTGMLIGGPVGLAADSVGLPSGGAAAFAALAFLALALGVRWLALRAVRSDAEVTQLFEDPADEERARREAA